jgi:hypothetical protein
VSERELWLDEHPGDVWALWSNDGHCFYTAEDLALESAFQVLWEFRDLRRCFVQSLMWLYGGEPAGMRDFTSEQVRAALRATGL